MSEYTEATVINTRYKEIAIRIPAAANENKKRGNGLIALVRKRSLGANEFLFDERFERHRLDNHNLANYR